MADQSPHRYEELHPAAPYHAAWRDYRRRTLLFAPLIPGFFILLGLVLWDCWRARETGLVHLEILLPALGYIAVFIVMGLRYRFWKCPRCRRPYEFDFKKPLARRLPGWFRKECAHCGLPLWAPGEELHQP